MTKQKSLKKSLAKSAVAMTLCAGMLIGSTYAWFSDSASTATNNITAGNLDIKLEVYSGSKWKESTDKSKQYLFDETTFSKIKWEPGMMEVSNPFRVENVGSLWLTYEITANVGDETSYTWPDDSEFAGKTVQLSDVVKMAVVTNSTYESVKKQYSLNEGCDYTARKNAWDQMLKTDDITDTSISKCSYSSPLKPGKEMTDEDSKVVVLFWEATDSTAKDNLDNEYNLPTDVSTELKIEGLGLNVFATQTPHEDEKDSFGDQYDAGAIQVHEISTAFESGINGLDAQIKAALSKANIKDFDSAITIGEPKVDEATGNISAEMKFGSQFGDTSSGGSENAPKALGTAFVTCADSITDVLFEQKDIIDSITIHGNAEETKTVSFADISEKDDLGKNLYAGLVAAVIPSALQGKNTCALTVDVASKNGASSTYVLNFDFQGSKILDSQSMGSYVAGIFAAVKEKHPTWDTSLG